MIKNLNYKIKKAGRILRYSVLPKKCFELDICKKCLIIISHSDYLNSLGGTEKYIFERIKEVELERDVLQIFPQKRLGLLDDKTKNFYGVNFNKAFIGYYPIETILFTMEKYTKDITSLEIHHSLFWQYKDFRRILEYSRHINSEVTYYMHDLFSFTPSVYKIYTTPDISVESLYYIDSEYTIYDPLSSTEQIKNWRDIMSNIFTYCNKIVVPSEFLFNLCTEFFTEYKDKCYIKEHLRLHIQNRFEYEKKDKIRIAYLGYISPIKGWTTWNKIINDKHLNDKYSFYHLGCSEKYAENVTCESYSFIDDGMMAAVDMLEKHSIDVVFLWSLIPESYSYTLHESIAAGIPVITNVRSGNIASVVKNKKEVIGEVLQGEKELVNLLKSDKLVNELVKSARNVYSLEYNSKIRKGESI